MTELVRELQAVQGTQVQQQQARTITISDQAQVGSAHTGDVQGNLTIGPVSFGNPPPPPLTTPTRAPAASMPAASTPAAPQRLYHAILKAYPRPAFELLCVTLGTEYDRLRGDTLELKIAYLVEDARDTPRYATLVQQVLADHPHVQGMLDDTPGNSQ